MAEDGTSRALADGNRIRSSGLACGRCETGPRAWTPSAGRSSWGTGTSTRPRRTATRRAWGRPARERCPPRRGVRHDQVPPRADPVEAATAASSGSGSIASTCTSSTGRGAARPGRGPGWSEHVSSATHGRSASPTTARRGGQLLRGERAASGESGAVQPVRVPQGILDACARRDRARGLQPPGNRTPPRSETATHRARLGRTPRRCCSAGASSGSIPIIPKSTHRERIAENARLFDFTLSDEDMAELDALDRTGGTDAGAREQVVARIATRVKRGRGGSLTLTMRPRAPSWIASRSSRG